MDTTKIDPAKIDTAKVADLTVEELMARLREELRPLVREAVAEAIRGNGAYGERRDQRGILDIPPLHLPPGHPALTIISREEMYGDDER